MKMFSFFIALGIFCILAGATFKIKNNSQPHKKVFAAATAFSGIFSIISFLIATGIISSNSNNNIEKKETFQSGESSYGYVYDHTTESVTFVESLSTETDNIDGNTGKKTGNQTLETQINTKANTTVVLEYKGEIKTEKQKDVYQFSPNLKGTYRFEIADLNAEKQVSMYITDIGGGEISRNIWIKNGDGITINDLEVGKNYNIVIQQERGYSQYVLKIGQQQPTVDINGAKSIKGNIVFIDQVNKYSFSPLIPGTYRFEINDLYAEKKVSMYIIDEGGGVVTENLWLDNGEGITTNQLKANNKYMILIQQEDGFSKYSLKIGYQSATQSIYCNSVETGTISFKDQVNIYSFVPSTAKQYRFEISDVQSGKNVSMYISDQGGGNLETNTWLENGEGISTDRLKAGETYYVKIVYANGYTPYSLIVK